MKKVVFNRFVGLLLAGTAVMSSCTKEGSSPSTNSDLEKAKMETGGTATISGNVYGVTDYTPYRYDVDSDSTDLQDSFFGVDAPRSQDHFIEGVTVVATYNEAQLYAAPPQGVTLGKKKVSTTTDAEGNYTLAIPTGATVTGVDVTLEFVSKNLDVKLPEFATTVVNETTVYLPDTTDNGSFFIKGSGVKTFTETLARRVVNVNDLFEGSVSVQNFNAQGFFENINSNNAALNEIAFINTLDND